MLHRVGHHCRNSLNGQHRAELPVTRRVKGAPTQVDTTSRFNGWPKTGACRAFGSIWAEI